jgi:hypothetical protein
LRWVSRLIAQREQRFFVRYQQTEKSPSYSPWGASGDQRWRLRDIIDLAIKPHVHKFAAMLVSRRRAAEAQYIDQRFWDWHTLGCSKLVGWESETRNPI